MNTGIIHLGVAAVTMIGEYDENFSTCKRVLNDLAENSKDILNIRSNNPGTEGLTLAEMLRETQHKCVHSTGFKLAHLYFDYHYNLGGPLPVGVNMFMPNVMVIFIYSPATRIAHVAVNIYEDGKSNVGYLCKLRYDGYDGYYVVEKKHTMLMGSDNRSGSQISYPSSYLVTSYHTVQDKTIRECMTTNKYEPKTSNRLVLCLDI
jgi:hypothetical protein